MWEFFHLRRARDGWHAGIGGGAHARASRANPGYYDDPPNWGRDRDEPPEARRTIRIAELEAGRIDHGLALGAARDARRGLLLAGAGARTGW